MEPRTLDIRGSVPDAFLQIADRPQENTRLHEAILLPLAFLGRPLPSILTPFSLSLSGMGGRPLAHTPRPCSRNQGISDRVVDDLGPGRAGEPAIGWYLSVGDHLVGDSRLRHAEAC